MHGAVTRHAAHHGQGIGPDQHGEMALAAAVIAAMPGMAMAFIDHFQTDGRKGLFKSLLDFLL
jgi:hypothetical protein